MPCHSVFRRFWIEIHGNQFDIDNLYVKEAYVGKGLVMKRFHARARGRGARIIQPFSHLTIL